MANEKLSARQKMISMMYLVLTAMLALQVSSSVLDKFALLENSIDKSRLLQMGHNFEMIHHIQTLVHETGNRTGDLAVLNDILVMRKKAEEVVQYIDNLKEQLITLEGGRDTTTKLPKGLRSDYAVSCVMLNDGEADKLKMLLNSYVAYVSKEVGKVYPEIAFDAKNHNFFSHNPNQAFKDFATLNFDHTPLGTALATLSQFSAEVVSTESDALKILANKIGASDIKFDILQPLVNTQSNIVAAGANYQADLLLTAASSGVDPEMFIDGKKVPIENGVGKISFLATPEKYGQDGLSKKRFQADIKLKLPGGEDRIFTKEVEYFVAKPVIQIKADSVQALYHQCGNELNIQVPSLGNVYRPSFSIKGGEIVQGRGRGLVTVIPHNKKEVQLTVYNISAGGDKILVGEPLVFKVRKIPMPMMRIIHNQKPVDLKQGISLSGLRKLTINIMADEGFQTFLPKDARYKMVEAEVILARGRRPVKEPLRIYNEEVNLTNLMAVAKTGDQLVIDVKKIKRINFKNEEEIVAGVDGNFIQHVSLN